jgi:tetratricopeptide (TPR) repeat protein
MLGVERTASAAIPPFLQGLSDIERRQYLEAAAKFLSAIQIDSTFVEAWRMRYIALVNAGLSTAERLQALSTAYRLRDRLRSPFWRAEITTDYLRVTGQHARVIAVFDSLLRIAPRGGFINNQGLAYNAIRRYDAALSTYQRSIDPAYSRLTVANSNLVSALLRLNRIEDAKAEYKRMLAHADSLQAIPRQARYSLATATRDWRAFAQLADDEARGTSTSNRIRSLEYRRALAAVRGQIARFDSLEVLRTGEYLAVGAPGNYLTAFGTAARLHAATSDSAGSRRLLAQGLSKVPLASLHPLDRPYVTIATALAWMGEPSRADSLLTDWSRNYPAEFKPADSLDILVARGEVALARGNAREALRLFKLADVQGCVPCFYPRYARAYDALRMSDSSLAFYERYATATMPANPIGDAFELARTYRRLGELYEERRDWKHAVQRYQDFVNLWEHADPSLRQAVNDVRARIERIRPKAS